MSEFRPSKPQVLILFLPGENKLALILKKKVIMDIGKNMFYSFVQKTKTKKIGTILQT